MKVFLWAGFIIFLLSYLGICLFALREALSAWWKTEKELDEMERRYRRTHIFERKEKKTK